MISLTLWQEIITTDWVCDLIARNSDANWLVLSEKAGQDAEDANAETSICASEKIVKRIQTVGV